jgi:hypothetical protein
MTTDTTMERIKYTSGQLLSAADLTAEQDYFLAKHRRHNRFLHGWGVVSGLSVGIEKSSAIVVSPGVALDCVGNEIHVCDQVRLQLPHDSAVLFVLLASAETETAPIPAPATTDELIYTRIRDGYLLNVTDLDPMVGHPDSEAGTPGCGIAHPLCIAQIRKGLKGWKVSLRGRRRQGAGPAP